VAFFHVSSVLNRASIDAHGLDWRLMGAAPGIAGSPSAEVEGCFLCEDEWTADWFRDLNNTGGPVDVWSVDGVEVDSLLDAGSGFVYFPGVIGRDQLTLFRRGTAADVVRRE
jgi:hypothetical protein